MFHVTADGKRLLMATDTTDLPAPAFAFPVCYPTRRTSRRLNRRREQRPGFVAPLGSGSRTEDDEDAVEDDQCRQHRYVFVEFRQTRRGDEAETAVYRCSVCSRIRMD